MQTITKANVRRIFYGDAYRKQQDELKRQREEQKRKEEEERKQKAEEERKRLEEEKRKAEQEAAEQAEQERLEQERREAEEKARAQEQREQDRLARNPYAMWIYLGPAELELLPEALNTQINSFNLVNGEAELKAPIGEASSGVFGLGFAVPVWDLIFVQVNGEAAGYAPEFAVFEAGRDLTDLAGSQTRSGVGIGSYSRILRTSGEIQIGYRAQLRDILELTGLSIQHEWVDRLAIEPLVGYRAMQHDGNLSFTASGASTFGPSQYLADEETDVFHRSKGVTWGVRFFYQPLSEFPLKLELGLYAARLSGDTNYNDERLTIYNIGEVVQDKSESSLRQVLRSSTIHLGVHYEIVEDVDVFVRLHGETVEYETERIRVTRQNSWDPSVSQASLMVAALSPVIAPVFDTEDQVGALQIGMTRRF